MSKYNVIIDVQSVRIEVEAESEQQAMDKAQVQFYHEMSHGCFEVEDIVIDDYQEEE